MKIKRNFTSLAIFTAFLLVGYQAGFSLESSGWLRSKHQATNSPSLPLPSESVATVLPNGQHTMLLIIVDDLEAPSPRLESIWIMSYVSNNTHLTFLPLYPSLSGRQPDPDLSLQGKFGFTSSAGRTQLDPGFQTSLHEQIPWWGSFLLLDRAALSAWMNDQQGVSELPHAWEDPRAALLGQASLYQDLCWNSSWAESSMDLRKVIQRLPAHVLSSLDQDQLFEQIDDMNTQIGRFSCEFPTLAVPGSVNND